MSEFLQNGGLAAVGLLGAACIIAVAEFWDRVWAECRKDDGED